MVPVQLTLGSGEVQLAVRRFSVEEKLNSMFRASIWAVSPHAALDLASLVGTTASLHLHEPQVAVPGQPRAWFGVVGFIEQTRAERHGESSYRVEIAPSLWLLSHRRNHRLFQHLTVPQMADLLFDEWGIERVWHVDRTAYPRLSLKTQHGESDLTFLSRILEEAGISFYFDPDPIAASRVVLTDAPDAGVARSGSPIPYTNVLTHLEQERPFVTHVRLAHEVRPGAYLYRDHDFRVPLFPLFAPAADDSPEARYEQYHYEPGRSRPKTISPV
jgi:type VI secretion system secreted protein VgrG